MGIDSTGWPSESTGSHCRRQYPGRPSRYEHTWGTAILRLFNLTAGCTGANEKSLRRAAIPFQAIHLHPGSHAGYYPGAEPIALKVLFAPDTGKLLGAQAIGHEGVDKRIDVLATALKAGMTVYDLAELELAYAPPYGSAKDPVNLAGMAAQNVLAGDVALAQWNEVASLDSGTTLLLDVRRRRTGAGVYSQFDSHSRMNCAKDMMNCLAFGAVADWCSGRMGVDVVDILGSKGCLGYRLRHAAGSFLGIGLHHVLRSGVLPIAENFRQRGQAILRGPFRIR